MKVAEYVEERSFLCFPQPAIEKGIDGLVVIPSYLEKSLFDSIQSLAFAEQTELNVEVVVVLNHSETADNGVVNFHQQQYEELCELRQNMPFVVHVLPAFALPKKHAGVGLARKIGMDFALQRLHMSGNPEGFIGCYDADCLCSPNYLRTLHQSFHQHRDVEAISIHFEHILDEAQYGAEVVDAIIDYEIFLRYYILGLRFAGHPHAHQTIGSSMAVRGTAYAKYGGMNRRKAGEDFYFLQKIIPHGHVLDVTEATVYPSPRVSDRVPFGTGKAVGDILNTGAYEAYAPEHFSILASVIEVMYAAYQEEPSVSYVRFPEEFTSFWTLEQWSNVVLSCKANSGSRAIFEYRLFEKFSAFQCLKWFHFARDKYNGNVSIDVAVDWLFENVLHKKTPDSRRQALMLLRKYDKG